ncbi:MAG: helix-turn-helix transcriptional regulator [Rhodothermaceae bacterium]|nr:helix-turn-helix transcriptional regulator [Rhodothermaceae bacterium]
MSDNGHPSAPCSVERAISIIGGKWKLYVIRILLVSGSQRYNGLLKTIEGISPKVLTENLRSLEQAGVICRTEKEGVQVYAMTSSGIGLNSILHAMGEWAEDHETLHLSKSPD